MNNQISLFSMTNSPDLEVVEMKFIDRRLSSSRKLFSGFKYLHVLTFSYDLDFINTIAKNFENIEIILGCEALVKFDLQTVMAFQTRSLQLIKKHQELIEGVASGKISFWITKNLISHQKVFILSNDDGPSRIIVGSANFSGRAFNGNQRENIGYFNNDSRAYDFYMEEFEFVRDFCSNEIVKDALYLDSTTPDKELESLPIIAEAKIKKGGIIMDNDIPTEKQQSVEFAYDIHSLSNKYAPLLPQKSETGTLKLMSPVKVTELIRKYKKSLHEETEKRKQYPQFIIDYETGTFTFNGSKVNTDNIDLESVCTDLHNLNNYFSGFDMFIGNYEQLKVIYFQLLNYMFLSPFIARLRYQASLTNFSLTLFPFYAVLNGPKSAGKSAFLDTVQSIMFGKKLGGISPDVFTRTKMYGLLRESAGVPLHIEDITKNRFRDYCGEIVKYDSDLISEKILNHPTVIMTSNDIQTIKPEYSKRIYYSIVDAQLTNVVAASQHKKMVECRNKIGTSFYREYLKRIYPQIVEMLNDMENYVFDESSSIWEPDIFNLSSKVIISIYEDCKIQIPPYVIEVSYADYFGHNSLTQSIKEKIIFEWAHNRKAFKVLRKQNRLEYVAGEKAYEAVNICQALPEELIPKQSGAKVVLKLDSAEKFFGIHFKNRLF